MNPTYHNNVLLLLAEAGSKNFCKKLESSIAICVKVNGNVDAYQVDNKVLAVRTVDNSGELSIVYNGFYFLLCRLNSIFSYLCLGIGQCTFFLSKFHSS